MVVRGGDRLERAISAVLRWQDFGETTREAFLATHADLRDLIEPMLAPLAAVADAETPVRRLGEFNLVRELGRGGMGVVFEAIQTSVDRRVALKVLPPHLTRAPSAVARFKREATLAARLRHPGIADVYAVGSEDDTHFFAMELVEGVPLNIVLTDLRGEGADLPSTSEAMQASVMARLAQIFVRAPALGGSASHWHAGTHVAAAVRVAADVADALEHAHAAQIVHRDIKPANILLRADGHAVVTDFGIARDALAPHMTVTGEFTGTPWYAAPEQIAGGRAADARSDVFSLGATLYELLTLRRPFEADTAVRLADVVRRRDPVSPQVHNPAVSGGLAAIVLKALEKDPGQRYQRARDFAADLRAYLDGRHVSAQRVGFVQRAWRMARRNPVVAALGAAFLVTLVVATVWIGLQNHGLRRALANVTRLADLDFVARLQNDHNHLPASNPADLATLVAWRDGANGQEGARHLVERGPVHRARLAELRARALPYTEADRRRDRETSPVRQRLLAARGHLEKVDETLADAARDGADVDLELVAAYRRFRPSSVRLVAQLEQIQQQRRTWRFAAPAEDWEHRQLTELVRRCDEFLSPEGGTWTKVNEWMEHMRTVRRRSLDEHADRWRDAVAAIADPAGPYRGLRLSPQLGLVPIGPDPRTGLWEFAHLQTGAIARRDSDGGLVADEHRGLVFVLLPGASFRMGSTPADKPDTGSTNLDPFSREEEWPEHTVTLAPFFVSKFEMTQAQWERFLGQVPAQFACGQLRGRWIATAAHPVETVSWVTCDEVLTAMGLAFPTEAQWEYAARAGSTAVFGYGDAAPSLAGAENVGDRCTTEAYSVQPDPLFGPNFDDGFGATAPVGSYRPNAFGLHDMLGNVQEWCADRYADYDVPPRSGDGLRDSPISHGRILRGGYYGAFAEEVRPARRTWVNAESLAAEIGLRPARAIDP